MCNKEAHYVNECPKKKRVGIKIFEGLNDLEWITDSEYASDNDRIYYLFDETLSSSYSE